MKTIGILGGIGPESTIEYYRLIISSCLDLDQSGNYPKIIINSINMKKMLDLIGENRLSDVSFYLATEVNKLAAAGADFALMASNTPHIVFDEIERTTLLPMISIIKATCRETTNQRIKRVGLFGTKFTMKGGFYEKIFSQHQIEVMIPNDADQDYIHHKYMSELVKGIVLDETRKGLLDILQKLKKDHRIEGLILGGTELPLILNQSHAPDVTILDTTRIHVESVINRLYPIRRS